MPASSTTLTLALVAQEGEEGEEGGILNTSRGTVTYCATTCTKEIAEEDS